MAQANPEDARYFVGCVENVEEFMQATGAVVQMKDSAELDDGAHAVLVSSELQYSDTILPELGPNAQMVEDEAEARTVYRVLVEGRTHEPPRSRSA